MKIIEGILQAQDKKFGIVSAGSTVFTEQLLKGAGTVWQDMGY